MANRKPLVLSSGRPSNIPVGDALDLTGADSFIVLDEHTSSPATPASGTIAVYGTAAGALAVKDDAGAITVLGAGGGASAPAGEIVFGTGGSVTSDPDFTYANATGQFWVNTINGTTGSVSVAAPGHIVLFGVSNSVAGGNSGNISILVPPGTDEVVAGTAIGGNSGFISFTTNKGGDAENTAADANSAAGGGGGNITIEGGDGGAGDVSNAAATGQALGGNAAGISLAAGTGGAATNAGSDDANGGTGGVVQIGAGTGGAAVSDTGIAFAGQGGDVVISAGGAGTATTGGGSVVGAAGGALTLQSGNASVAASGGNITVTAGAGGTTGIGGEIEIVAGAGGSVSGDGGNVVLRGGAVTSGDVGSVAIGSGTTSDTRNGDMMYIPTSAGTPTGTPATIAGLVPLIFDTTNNVMYVYSGGTWITDGATWT